MFFVHINPRPRYSSENRSAAASSPYYNRAYTIKHDMSDLIVDFPDQRKHRAELIRGSTVYEVACHELWYTKDEYYSMKLDIREDVLRARSMQSLPFNYSGYDDDDDDDDFPEEMPKCKQQASFICMYRSST
jgi:hypothetical protein